MTTLDFYQFNVPRPTGDGVTGEYEAIWGAMDAAGSAEEDLAAVRQWDDLRRRLDTWKALVHLRFNQDTSNEQYRSERAYCDGLTPQLTELDVATKRRLLNSERRAELAERLGDQAFALWEVDVLTFDPAIKDDLVRESELEAEYNELLASAELSFRGETYNHAGISKFVEDPDRTTRHDADKVRWDWFAENGEAFDRIFDDLVKLRTAMARKLGYENYIGMGYKRMARIDYGQQDVERYRRAVREHVVPLCGEIRRQQAATLGLAPDDLRAWDLAVFNPAGNPAPQGDHDWLIARAQEMFASMGSGLDEFFRLMVDAHLLDLKNRPSKAGGGFCTDFPSYGVPFIFANFNGTKGDVEVFTHEMGHAFQGYSSREQPLVDYLWPTYESCEIHSMSLEFLTWPYMEKFFGDEAERFRKLHLTGSLLFLPYGVAVDHFQHLVYAEPDATPAERKAMWREMEQTYLPWLDYGDLAYPSGGGRWQLQRHIYLNPFYYIDYTLAQVCALQFWLRSEKDFDEAMQAFVALCRRGGEAPFQELARSAGLVSPFEPGCLEQVVGRARETLGV